jgi:hypothetical protein
VRVDAEERDLRRKRALDAYLAARCSDGFRLETWTDTHAIVARRGLAAGLLERIGLNGRRRHAISVDEHGSVTARPAERVRW